MYREGLKREYEVSIQEGSETVIVTLFRVISHRARSIAMRVPFREGYRLWNCGSCHVRGTGSVRNAIFKIAFANASIADGNSWLWGA
ncbi:MAG: hypothetical protein COA62_04020 [Rhodobiaceae bacterium]|nr:MAG: hypothetical protein COA62_04020 [Rhodobiaceae bacterium]